MSQHQTDIYAVLDACIDGIKDVQDEYIKLMTEHGLSEGPIIASAKSGFQASIAVIQLIQQKNSKVYA